MIDKEYHAKWAREKRKRIFQEFLAQKHYCKGCREEFVPTSLRNLFHNKACMVKYYSSKFNPIRKVDSDRKSQCSWQTTVTRQCLSCFKNFKSFGNWNRVCINCKKQPVFSNSIGM